MAPTPSRQLAGMIALVAHQCVQVVAESRLGSSKRRVGHGLVEVGRRHPANDCLPSCAGIDQALNECRERIVFRLRRLDDAVRTVAVEEKLEIARKGCGPEQGKEVRIPEEKVAENPGGVVLAMHGLQARLSCWHVGDQPQGLLARTFQGPGENICHRSEVDHYSKVYTRARSAAGPCPVQRGASGARRH